VFPTGDLSDYAGVWSHWTLEAVPPERRERARIVGNPRNGAFGASARSKPARQRPVAVILVEHHSRQTALLDRRITARHLAAAIDGLRRSRRDWRIVVRPHPVDEFGEIAQIAAEIAGEPIRVDGHTPATELLADADLCVGALSTATLEAAQMGTRVVMLNPSRIGWTPPLTSGSSVVVAATADELARAVDEVMEAPEPPGAAELLEGLGVGVADPAGLTVDWIRELIQPPSLIAGTAHARPAQSARR
jgi:ADP-heptose:LPS heptosyltransferase